MQTVQINPYQIELTTKVQVEPLHGDFRLLKMEDTILPDYKKWALLPEHVRVNGVALDEKDILPHGLRIKQAPREHATIQVPFADRLLLLRNNTARLLLREAVRFHFASDVLVRPVPGHPESFSLTLLRHTLPEEMPDIVACLSRRLTAYRDHGLHLRTKAETGETTLYGIFTTPWQGPHLFHTAELGGFTLVLDPSEDLRILVTLTPAYSSPDAPATPPTSLLPS